jgi:EAL and modified HD-GYP domain-containing signal transduction protein
MEHYLARYPIFRVDRTVFAYEISSRFELDTYRRTEEHVREPATTIDELFLLGIQKMTQGLPAFLKCTREFLVGEYLALLPNDVAVGEIPGTIAPDDEVVAACQRLREKGYKLALKGYEDRPETKAFLEVADFIKVDFQAKPPNERARLAQKFKNWGIPLIAETVETEEEFKSGTQMGYAFFQGHFFCRPQRVARKTLPTNSAMCLRLLQETQRPNVDLAQIASLMKQEASLSYRLLRYLNSPAFALRGKVRSIPHAISLLGERAMKKWISLVCVAGIGEGKPGELIKIPLLRARFCELLAERAGMRHESNDLYLLGLLSMMDVLLDRPMGEILAGLPVNGEIKGALQGVPGRFQRVLELAVDYDAGSWEKLTVSAKALGVQELLLPELHLKALEWADRVMTETPVSVNR